jgi:hypothetical protein
LKKNAQRIAGSLEGETAGHDVLHYFVLADKSSFALELGRIAHSDSMLLGAKRQSAGCTHAA